MIKLCILGLLAWNQGGDSIDAEAFERLMAETSAGVDDVSFVFEGMLTLIPKGETIETIERWAPTARVSHHQGGYTFRSDGATRLDSYIATTRKGETGTNHTLSVILDRKQHDVWQAPGDKENPTERSGGPGTLNRPSSPERINYYWYFKTMVDARWRGYEFLGWENVDGRRCLKVQFDEIWGMNDHSPDRRVVRFWIDLERGGHPLRVEFRDVKGVRMRAVGIELASFADAEGKPRWLPVRGRFESLGFPGMETYGETPYCHEDYQVVAGTARFNQKPPDAFFKVDWKGPLVETPKLVETRDAFKKAAPRYDRVGIQTRLAKTLADADEDSARLDASPQTWGWSFWGLPSLFVATGAAVVLGAALWKRQYGA